MRLYLMRCFLIHSIWLRLVSVVVQCSLIGVSRRFLLTFQGIPHGVAGGWRTGIVVVSPGEISWRLHLSGKVHHIIISHRVETILVLQYLMIFIEVRISARSSLLNVCSHIAERRMIGHALGYSAIQACCDNRQGTALTSALHSHILSVPFGERGKEVDAAHQSLIHMAHVVAVLIFQAIGKIASVSIVESLAYLLEGFGRKAWVESMDFYLEADESVLGIILVAQGSLMVLMPAPGGVRTTGWLPCLAFLG